MAARKWGIAGDLPSPRFVGTISIVVSLICRTKASGDGRELTALLQEHIAEFGTGSDGRLFVGAGRRTVEADLHARLPVRRKLAFTEEVARSLLAATPYTLRHGWVSTWLNGGVPGPSTASASCSSQAGGLQHEP